MQYRNLGNTEIKISRIGLGSWVLPGGLDWGEQDRRTSMDTILAAVEQGVNFFDTAEMYGDGVAEEILGETLKHKRLEVVIASKVHRTPMTAKMVKVACEESLKRLQTDYIDLYQIHYIDRNTSFEETMEGFIELKNEGKIRAIGVCNSGIRDMDRFMKIIGIQSNQLPYNLLWRAAEFGLKEKCINSGVSFLAYSVLMLGLLTGKFESADEVPAGRARTRHFSKDRPYTRHKEPGFEAETFETIKNIKKICGNAGIAMNNAAINWVLAQEGITAVIVGARTPKQIKTNIENVDMELPVELITGLSKATEKLKGLLGVNADLWQHESRLE
jgi:myo-inositol catabolism protein IolS